jgi:TolB-like protein
MDVVGYSKLLINDQTEILELLSRIVRDTNQFREADVAGRLIRLATGDGMALVFFNSVEAPVKCALEIAEALQSYPNIPLRMGVHSGPINPISDVNDRTNVTGAGINMAQRIMDCGDAGHILLSRRVAEDLEQYRQWQPYLRDLGEYEVKHGVRVHVFNLCTDKLGNRNIPEKVRLPPHRISQRKRNLIVGIIALILLLGLATSYWMIGHRGLKSVSGSSAAGAITSVPGKSIAVLPFENLSKNEENAFFAGGVQDEILNDLAKIADLKVISRTSVMKYKSGPERNLREIAKTLGVSHVVEGSVQRAGERVRVSAQLIDARNDAHLWAEHYDRDVTDIFAIQTEIAQQIANQLQAKLSAAESAAIAERPTSDLVAYAYYTRAKEIDIYGNWEGAENEKAANQKVELLEKATQRDPTFALAYCALAKAQMDLVSDIDHKPLELAKKAAETALRLRPDLAEGHLALARYYWLAPDFIGVDRETYYDQARDELAIVHRKLPNNAEAPLIEAVIGRRQNRWEASLANLRRANELDPQNDEVEYRLHQIYFEMRRYSELEQQLTRKYAASGDPGVKRVLANIKLAEGDPIAAQSLLEQVPREYSPGEWIWETRFKNALYLRDYDAANRVIGATPANYADEAFLGPSDWAYGLVARARGDKEKAVAAFAAAREKMEAQWSDKPKDAAYFADVAKLDAALGRKEDAIREAEHVVELQPISKDSLNGPTRVANLALVYAWTGERDRALEQLEIVATLPGYGPTYGDLLLNPCWDDLRGDKRFDKIVAAAKAASR